MNNSKTISLTCAIAVTLWSLSSLLVIAGLVLELLNPGKMQWHGIALGVANIGIVLGMGGATLSVRGYFIRFGRHLERRESEWERQAFEMGADFGRSENGRVRPLR